MSVVARPALVIAGPLALLLSWQVMCSAGLLSAEILPDPATVLRTARDMLATGDLQANLAISLRRLIRGVAIGLPLGAGLGLAMGVSRRVEEYVYPTFRAITLVPFMAWLPLLMLIFGIGETLKTVAIAKAGAVPMAIATFAAIRGIPKAYREVGTVLRLRPWTQLRRLVLPAIAAPLLVGVRQSLGNAWVALVAVELLASTEGIGYLMNWGRVIFQLDVVIVGIIVVGTIGFALDAGMRGLEALLVRRTNGRG